MVTGTTKLPAVNHVDISTQTVHIVQDRSPEGSKNRRPFKNGGQHPVPLRFGCHPSSESFSITEAGVSGVNVHLNTMLGLW